MGLFVIHNGLIEKEPEIVMHLFNWFKQECKASIWETTTPMDISNKIKRYVIEGNGIPKNSIHFDIECTRIVKDVYSFNLL